MIFDPTLRRTDALCTLLVGSDRLISPALKSRADTMIWLRHARMHLGDGTVCVLAQVRISPNLFQNLPARAARENFREICLSVSSYSGHLPVLRQFFCKS